MEIKANKKGIGCCRSLSRTRAPSCWPQMWLLAGLVCQSLQTPAPPLFCCTMPAVISSLLHWLRHACKRHQHVRRADCCMLRKSFVCACPFPKRFSNLFCVRALQGHLALLTCNRPAVITPARLKSGAGSCLSGAMNLVPAVFWLL